jgi:hypothetical protein
MNTRNLLIALSAALLVGGTAFAGPVLENFESEAADSNYSNASGWVEVYLDSFGGATPYVAGVGAPTTSFLPLDYPHLPSFPGNKFLSDDDGRPLTERSNYYFMFKAPITSLKMDVYDFRRDGGAQIGDTIRLSVYDSIGGSVIASDEYTIQGSNHQLGIELDGWTLVLDAGSFARTQYASLEFVNGVGDVGMGIDNLQFNVVPEPATLTLVGLGIAGIALRKRLSK